MLACSAESALILCFFDSSTCARLVSISSPSGPWERVVAACLGLSSTAIVTPWGVTGAIKPGSTGKWAEPDALEEGIVRSATSGAGVEGAGCFAVSSWNSLSSANWTSCWTFWGLSWVAIELDSFSSLRSSTAFCLTASASSSTSREGDTATAPAGGANVTARGTGPLRFVGTTRPPNPTLKRGWTGGVLRWVLQSVLTLLTDLVKTKEPPLNSTNGSWFSTLPNFRGRKTHWNQASHVRLLCSKSIYLVQK